MKRLCAVLMMLVVWPAWADDNDGYDAYERGDYATALKEWRPLAEQGEAIAQNNLGLMYDNGTGV
ncbi:MAG: sel1 repeat family protein, partial [Proteobacteria bacterium]|nr:sel1 repeat family protein [Pseudomonadota bacterium]